MQNKEICGIEKVKTVCRGPLVVFDVEQDTSCSSQHATYTLNNRIHCAHNNMPHTPYPKATTIALNITVDRDVRKIKCREGENIL